MMKKDKKLPWILAGYKMFWQQGVNEIKIEALAREVKKNKSSFYHLFADLNIFIEHLLDYHLSRAEIISIKESQSTQVIPDLLNVLVEFKEDLLFSRQLRIHRDNTIFRKCYETSNKIVGDGVLVIWAEFIGLGENKSLANSALEFGLDNFYLQITEETLTHDWLLNYFIEFQSFVRKLKESEKNSIFAR